MKTKYKVILIVTFFAFLGLAYGFYLFNKPVDNLLNRKPHHRMLGSELLEAFEGDEDLANKKYLDKIIEVKGNISKIEDHKSIYIDTGNPLSLIIFEMEEGQDITSLKVGDVITIKGLCTGYLMDVVMVRSILMDQSKN